MSTPQPQLGQVTTVFSQESIYLKGRGVAKWEGGQCEFNNSTVSLNGISRLEFHIDGTMGVVLNCNKPNVPFDDLFDGMDSSLAAKEVGSNVFEISGTANNGDTHYDIGRPKNIEQSVSFYRKDPNWVQPEAAKGKINVPNNQGVAIQFQRTDGMHVVIFPVAGRTDCTAYVYGNGKIRTYIENDSETKPFQILVSVDCDLDNAWKKVFEVRRLPKSDPNYWYKGLMYCTWNGLGGQLSEDSIINALQDLDKNNIHIKGLIIDDGWQHTNSQRQLYDFEAHPDRFTSLKALTSNIRKKFPYIKDIGVWSTVVGYWNGLVPDSVLDRKYKTVDVNCGGQHIRIVDKPDVSKFYHDYFSFLANSGVTCIKLDNQATIDQIRERDVRGRLWEEYQDVIWEAAKKYFDERIIYCMAMVPNIMQRLHSAAVFRNSDDFFPDVPSSHHWHVYTNIMCTQFTKHLAVLDYDMFQTEMPGNFASLHAAARCISGGPIYFTDTPGQHDLGLIKSFSDTGTGEVFPLEPPKLIDPYHSYTSSKALRTVNQWHGATVYGLFNVSDSKVDEDVTSSGREVMRSFTDGTLWKGDRTFHLGPGEWEIITAVPVLRVEPGDEELGVGFLGRLDHIAGITTLDNIMITAEENHIEAQHNVKSVGKYGFYVENLERGSVTAELDGDTVSIDQQDELITVACDRHGSLVVKVFFD